MGTIITVKGADFSANNLGNFADYSNFTARTLDFRDTANLNLESGDKIPYSELLALNNLDLAIESLGLWSKIRTFFPFKGSVTQQLQLNFKDVDYASIPAASRNGDRKIQPNGWDILEFKQIYAYQKDFGIILNQDTATDITGVSGNRKLINASNILSIHQTDVSGNEYNRFTSDQESGDYNGGIDFSSNWDVTVANGLTGFFASGETRKIYFNDGTDKSANLNNAFPTSGSDRYADAINEITIGNGDVPQTISMLMFTDGTVTAQQYADLSAAIKTYLTAVGEIIV